MTDTGPIPTRHAPTTAGTLRATCTHPNKVSFTTEPERPIVLHRVAYRCVVILTRQPVPAHLHNRYVTLTGNRPDGSGAAPWRAPLDAVWHALQRNGTPVATRRARQDFRVDMLPELARWLDTGDGHALLTEGDTHWRRVVAAAAVATERHLTEAVARARDLARRVADGAVLTPADEQFVTGARVQDHH
jgi:hypothetical protein